MFLFEQSAPSVTLLHVEDDEIAREVVLSALSRSFPGVEVLGAADGEEGLELFRKYRPEVVLTDLKLPGIDGIRLAQEILADAPGTEVIVISGYSDAVYFLEAIKMGIRHYLLKPLDLDPLLETVSQCLSQIALQKKVRRQEQYLRLLSQAVEERSLVAICDRTGSLLYINDKFCTFTGYTPQELLGTNLRQLHGDDPGSFDEAWAELCAGKEWRGEILRRKKDGTSYWESAAISPITDSDGNISHFVSIREDITSTRKNREEMERVQRLESLGVLAGGIAHDFNNALTGIMGSISLAQRTLMAGDPGRARLEEAQKASLRAAALTRQLLTFARGGKPLKKPVSVAHVLEESCSLALRGSDVRGRISLREGLHDLEVDPEQMIQAFVNILMNAVHAMPEGEVAVCAENVTLSKDNPYSIAPGRYVRVSFADSGCGIPQSDLEKIFDPYFSTKPGGTGLGLSATHSIITRHGGHIAVESSPGRGATFVCLLPSTGEACTESAPAPGPPAPQEDSPHCILLMDDESIVRKVTGKMLECLGYRVTVCNRGEEAIEEYRRRHAEGVPYWAVIMDLTVIGGMGGKEAAGHILALDPDACLVVSSGYYDDPVLADYRQYGFRAVLPKPYKSDDLARLLGSLRGEDVADSEEERDDNPPLFGEGDFSPHRSASLL